MATDIVRRLFPVPHCRCIMPCGCATRVHGTITVSCIMIRCQGRRVLSKLECHWASRFLLGIPTPCDGAGRAGHRGHHWLATDTFHKQIDMCFNGHPFLKLAWMIVKVQVLLGGEWLRLLGWEQSNRYSLIIYKTQVCVGCTGTARYSAQEPRERD